MPPPAELATGAFSVLPGDSTYTPLLVIPLDPSYALSSGDEPPLLNEWTRMHLPVQAVCHALALLFGCLHYSNASSRPIAVNALRFKVYNVGPDGRMGVLMNDASLGVPMTPGRGVYFQLCTHEGKVVQFAEVANNDFLRFCMTEIVDAAVKEGKTKERSSKFKLDLARLIKPPTCLVLGAGPRLHAMHVFERRWGTKTFDRLVASLNALVHVFLHDLHNYSPTEPFEFDKCCDAHIFAPAYCRIQLYDNDAGVDDKLNGNFASPTLHDLLDSRCSAIYRQTFYYLHRDPTAAVWSHVRVTQNVPIDAAFEASPPRVQYLDRQRMLWDLRWAVTIVLLFRTSFLQGLISGMNTGKKRSADNASAEGRHQAGAGDEPRKRQKKENSSGPAGGSQPGAPQPGSVLSQSLPEQPDLEKASHDITVAVDSETGETTISPSNSTKSAISAVEPAVDGNGDGTTGNHDQDKKTGVLVAAQAIWPSDVAHIVPQAGDQHGALVDKERAEMQIVEEDEVVHDATSNDEREEPGDGGEDEDDGESGDDGEDGDDVDYGDGMFDVPDAAKDAFFLPDRDPVALGGEPIDMEAVRIVAFICARFEVQARNAL